MVKSLLPEAAAVYPSEDITDRDERFLAAEFIREKIFGCSARSCLTPRPLPSIASCRKGDLRRIHATVYVERGSQKAILLGAGGVQMKEIATRARADMERLFGGRVFLEIWVRVKKGWADDNALLKRMGY